MDHVFLALEGCGNNGLVFHILDHVLTAFQIVVEMVLFLLVPLVAAPAVAHGDAVVLFAQLKEPTQRLVGTHVVDVLTGHAQEYKVVGQILSGADTVKRMRHIVLPPLNQPL